MGRAGSQLHQLPHAAALSVGNGQTHSLRRQEPLQPLLFCLLLLPAAHKVVKGADLRLGQGGVGVQEGNRLFRRCNLRSIC